LGWCNRPAQPATVADPIELINALLECLEIFHKPQQHSSEGMFTPNQIRAAGQAS
jgi:hypothetical protein